MKTFLVATDYSANADNAMHYAAKLAKDMDAKLILFHSFHVPLPIAEAPVIVVTADELQKEHDKRMQKMSVEIKSTYGVDTTYISCYGFLHDELEDVIKEKNVDLLVMGIKGATSKVDFIFGSNTTTALRKLKKPILVVPNGVSYKSPKTLAFAFDYHKEPSSESFIVVKEIVSKFNSEIEVLNVIKEGEIASYDKALVGIKFENIMQGIKHTLHFPVNNNIDEEIGYFIDTHKADILLMIPHKHSFFERILLESHSHNMAFMSHVPMLALPE